MVRIILSLGISSGGISSSTKFSLSSSDGAPPRVTVTGRIAKCSPVPGPVTFSVTSTSFNGGGPGTLGDAFFHGALVLTNAADWNMCIPMRSPTRFSQCSTNRDLRASAKQHFVTMPSAGEVTARFDLSRDRLSFYCDTYPDYKDWRGNVKPGDKNRLLMAKLDVVHPWWTRGDLEGDLRHKKFADVWNHPNHNEADLAGFGGDTKTCSVEELRGRDWVFTESWDNFKLVTDSDEGVLIEFVE